MGVADDLSRELDGPIQSALAMYSVEYLANCVAAQDAIQRAVRSGSVAEPPILLGATYGKSPIIGIVPESMADEPHCFYLEIVNLTCKITAVELMAINELGARALLKVGLIGEQQACAPHTSLPIPVRLRAEADLTWSVPASLGRACTLNTEFYEVLDLPREWFENDKIALIVRFKAGDGRYSNWFRPLRYTGIRVGDVPELREQHAVGRR